MRWILQIDDLRKAPGCLNDRLGPVAVLAVFSMLTGLARADDGSLPLERSYWLHASLADDARLNYWGTGFPPAAPATDGEIANAARLLSQDFAANRLYLIYNREIPLDAAMRVFRSWKRHCPRGVEIVPTLLLRMYDAGMAEVFPVAEAEALCGFLKREINPDRIAVYDVYPNRDFGKCLPVLSSVFPNGLIRVGLQPDEDLPKPFTGAVEDTWSAFCHGKTGEDWKCPGFGADALRSWVRRRNSGPGPIAWDLIIVAWDYAPTKRGEFPGYDDAEKNMPLPAGRNAQAAKMILSEAERNAISGFSSDLFILHVNSASISHDGKAGAFYRTLRNGVRYTGYYREPFEEIARLYGSIRATGGIE